MAETTAFELVTPSRVMMARDAGMVVVPGSEGLFGVLPRHAPMISTLQRGIVEVHENSQVIGRIMVDGGIADVGEERCTILAERAEMLDAGHRGDMEARLKEAESTGNETDADFIRAAIDAI